MKTRRYFLLFAVIVSALILFATLFILSSSMPSVVEPFFAFSVLGVKDGNMTVEHHFPGDDSNLQIRADGQGQQNVSWYLFAQNQMGIVQRVLVKVKILNSSLQAPDSHRLAPSPIPPLIEIERSDMKQNETWLFPFFWRIANAEHAQSGDSIVITRLFLNNEPLELPFKPSAVSGINFRMVFELWLYDEASQNFKFDWQSGGRRLCVWNQIWFNLTLTE